MDFSQKVSKHLLMNLRRVQSKYHYSFETVILYPSFPRYSCTNFPPIFSCRKVFLFLQKLLSFVEMTNPDLCFHLRLQATAAANRCAIASKDHKPHDYFAPIAYEFLSEAFLTYEAEISESSAQKKAMTKIIGTLLFCECFDTSDYEALITKTTQYAARLLKKTDQCSMILRSSHLFFKDEVCPLCHYLKIYLCHTYLLYIILVLHSIHTRTLNAYWNVYNEH